MDYQKKQKVDFLLDMLLKC